MNKKTKKITLSAVLTAFSIIFLYIAAVFPTGQLGFVAAAALFGIAAVIEAGISAGVFVYVCSAALGFLIVPNKSAMLLYTLFFGYYPVVKGVAERFKSRVVEWIIKFGIMNLALTVIIFAFSELIYDFAAIDFSIPVIYILFNVVFVVFDYGVSKLIAFYRYKISSKIKK